MKDFDCVERITRLLQPPASVSLSEPVDMTLQIAQLCANLAPTTTVLERFIAGDKEGRNHYSPSSPLTATNLAPAPADSLPSLAPPIQEITALFASPDASSLSADERNKLHLAVERLRRLCVKVFEIPDSPLRPRARELLLELVKHVEAVTICGHLNDSDDVSQRGALESLISLARAESDRVGSDSFALLERCMPLVEPFSDSARKAEMIKVVSNAYYICGAALYKEGKGGSAVGLFKVSCELGARALDVVRKCGDVSAEGEVHTWAAHKELMSRRWELMGVCAAKGGDRKVDKRFFKRARLRFGS